MGGVLDELGLGEDSRQFGPSRSRSLMSQL